MNAIHTPLSPEDPRDVGGYRLLAKIGEGGRGAVCLSRTRGNQPVALKVIHRDLKPSNILLSAEGPWVIDFGIARATDATQLTRSGGLVYVDLDLPKTYAEGGSSVPAGIELTYNEFSGFSSPSFLTTTGISDGPTAEQCAAAADTNALPATITGKKDLLALLPEGTLLCTVTKDGNLAMPRITKVEMRVENLPDYTTELTLWKPSWNRAPAALRVEGRVGRPAQPLIEKKTVSIVQPYRRAVCHSSCSVRRMPASCSSSYRRSPSTRSMTAR